MLASYPVPWGLVFGLTPHIRNRTQRNIDDFTAAIVARMTPQPEVIGADLIPRNPQFLLAANHYQRQGLWILFPAAVITQAMRQALGAGDPPMHWIVTANWPPIRLGRWCVPSPGDVLLPRVAHTLHCFPVSFARSNPGLTAVSIRRLLKAAPHLHRPIGLFPEGVAGVAGRLTDPLPGVGKLIQRLGRPVLPVGISETSRLVIRIGKLISMDEMSTADDPAKLAMRRIAALL